MLEKVAPAVLASVITGAVSSMGTVMSMQVHVDYLRENIVRHDKEISDVKKMIREIERKS